MPLNVAPSAPPFPVGAKPSFVSDLIQATASLFQLTAPAELQTARHHMLLLVMVVAALAARIWSLSAVGLHGDEETMGMAVRGILEQGAPILPSGMFYPRGITQLYMMAASVSLFGESEWALRLPSVLCGIVAIPIAYWCGRRFLRPSWCLAFAAAIAFLPVMIDYSQTARMYIFLVTAVLLSMACLFEWERTGRTRWLAGATIALIWGLDMHVLAVAAVLMFLMPGVLQGDGRKLLLGGLAAGTVVVAFVSIEAWLNSHYPTPPTDFVTSLPVTRPQQSLLRSFSSPWEFVPWLAAAAAMLFAWRVSKCVASAVAAACVAGLLFAGIALQLVLHYHLAALFLAAGAVIAVRFGSPAVAGRLAILLLAAAALLGAHLLLLAPESGTFVRLVGALVGQPSVWPYARLAQLSPIAGVALAALFAWSIYRLAHRQAAPDYFLLAVLGVFAPLFALGLFAWNIPPRYTAMSLAPMLLCALATAQHAADWLASKVQSHQRVSWSTAGATAMAVGMINPMAATAAINVGYGVRPDHKGAAEFMQTQHITDEDVVLAEDVLQQTYYLGRVDYWLVGPQVARRFVKRTDAGVVDFYTGTPVIITPDMLDKVLQLNEDKRVFIIGSGEDWRNGKRSVREDLQTALDSGRFTTVYLGRDGRTRVLRAIPMIAAPRITSAEEARAEKELTKDAQAAIEDADAAAEQPAVDAPGD